MEGGIGGAEGEEIVGRSGKKKNGRRDAEDEGGKKKRRGRDGGRTR